MAQREVPSIHNTAPMPTAQRTFQKRGQKNCKSQRIKTSAVKKSLLKNKDTKWEGREGVALGGAGI